ncbi:hypothetical protein BDQ17DRAFT_91261 [Cyathus striatus]|nr:hypothetical protein BDQ17DRAFT_91261 [Cyathus striatus]
MSTDLNLTLAHPFIPFLYSLPLYSLLPSSLLPSLHSLFPLLLPLSSPLHASSHLRLWLKARLSPTTAPPHHPSPLLPTPPPPPVVPPASAYAPQTTTTPTPISPCPPHLQNAHGSPGSHQSELPPCAPLPNQLALILVLLPPRLRSEHRSTLSLYSPY